MTKLGVETDEKLYIKEHLMSEQKMSEYRYKEELYKELIELADI